MINFIIAILILAALITIGIVLATVLFSVLANAGVTVQLVTLALLLPAIG